MDPRISPGMNLLAVFYPPCPVDIKQLPEMKGLPRGKKNALHSHFQFSLFKENPQHIPGHWSSLQRDLPLPVGHTTRSPRRFGEDFLIAMSATRLPDTPVLRRCPGTTLHQRKALPVLFQTPAKRTRFLQRSFGTT